MVTVADVDKVASLRQISKLAGSILGPFEAFLVARGLRTLVLRVTRQSENAAALAQWLSEQPQVATVHYPGLATHPQHLSLCWTRLKAIMRPGKIDMLTKEIIALAVSATNNCHD